jgi:hypothetical protein
MVIGMAEQAKSAHYRPTTQERVKNIRKHLLEEYLRAPGDSKYARLMRSFRFFELKIADNTMTDGNWYSLGALLNQVGSMLEALGMQARISSAIRRIKSEPPPAHFA